MGQKWIKIGHFFCPKSIEIGPKTYEIEDFGFENRQKLVETSVQIRVTSCGKVPLAYEISENLKKFSRTSRLEIGLDVVLELGWSCD